MNLYRNTQPKCGWCAEYHDPNIMCLDHKIAWRQGLGWGTSRIKAFRLLRKLNPSNWIKGKKGTGNYGQDKWSRYIEKEKEVKYE